MRDRQDLRKRVEQARRAAGIRTEGGYAADRQRMAFAQKLEAEAEAQERETPTKKTAEV